MTNKNKKNTLNEMTTFNLRLRKNNHVFKHPVWGSQYE